MTLGNQPPTGWQNMQQGQPNLWGAPPPPGGWPQTVYYVNNTTYPPPAGPTPPAQNGHGNNGGNAPVNQNDNNPWWLRRIFGSFGVMVVTGWLIVGAFALAVLAFIFVIQPAWDGGIKQEGGRRLHNVITHIDDSKPDPTKRPRRPPPETAEPDKVVVLTEADKAILRKVNMLDESLTPKIDEILENGYALQSGLDALKELAQLNQDKIREQLDSIEGKLDEALDAQPTPDTVYVTVTPEPYPPCGPDLQPRPCTTDP